MSARLPALVLLAAALVPSAPAAGIRWRTDYAAARQEALEKERPLLLDVVRDNCPWCTKLDATTFVDPSVVAAASERFVPLKIDGGRHPALAQALRIQSYPTLVVATPAGKILEMHGGYLDVGPFLEFLNRALTQSPAPAPPPAPSPAPPATATGEAYQTAALAIARGEAGRAVSLLTKLAREEGEPADRSRAAELLRELEEQASSRLAAARKLQAEGKLAEARAEAEELAQRLDGTVAAGEARQLAADLARRDDRTEPRPRPARDLLAQAREDFRRQQFLACLDCCETLSRKYPDSAEAGEAAELASKIKGNADWMQQVCDALPEWHSMLYMTLAEARLKQGQPQQAVFYLERIVQAYPNTRHAEMAQVRLTQIQGQPPLPVSDDKP